jgi:catechol 2,3-dioxygenase-like lactoylglutathione lyase family enzyme
MPGLQRIVFNILCKDLGQSALFYRELVGLEEIYRSNWYIVLAQPGNEGVQIGLIDQVSEFTPRHAWGTHNGTFLTLVVDDVFAALDRARALDIEIIEEPVALDYGQSRALIRDPNGLILDLSTPTELLAARDDVAFEVSPKTTAIDQPQPEERAGGSSVTL